MIYNSNNDLFHQMQERLLGFQNLDTSIYCKFERYGEKVTIELSNYSLDIKFDTFNIIKDENYIYISPEEDQMERYKYIYVNTDGEPEIFEEGDFEYFSIKFPEIYKCIDIDEIILNKVNFAGTHSEGNHFSRANRDYSC